MDQGNSEKALLLRYLNIQRSHVQGILDGLSDGDLRRPVLPTGWSALGLVQHLALDDERFWFQGVVAGEQSVIEMVARGYDGWHVDDDTSATQIFELYQTEIGKSNVIIESTSLDTAPAWWPDFFGEFRLHDLRQILLHVITETACHAGHADAARELIDKRTWLVLNQ